MQLAIKIDIDTLKGYLEGLPRLLEILKAHEVKASIFFSMGPDNSGKALRRIFRRGFITKMLRTKAPSTYGLKTLLYGTLLPAPLITQAKPDLIRRSIDEGHDCGVHSWDHVYWQDNLNSLTSEKIRGELEKAFYLFEKFSGVRALSCAAPGWQVNTKSLAVQDSLGLEYCSDVRGFAPFLPEMDGEKFKTPQIPSTLPTLDEVLGPVKAEDVSEYYFKLLKPGLNVHTIHTEMEGGNLSWTFDKFLTRCREAGVEFLTLKEIAEREKISKYSKIEMGYLPGRAGKLAIQK